jgi:hypothetical protein
MKFPGSFPANDFDVKREAMHAELSAGRCVPGWMEAPPFELRGIFDLKGRRHLYSLAFPQERRGKICR